MSAGGIADAVSGKQTQADIPEAGRPPRWLAVARFAAVAVAAAIIASAIVLLQRHGPSTTPVHRLTGAPAATDNTPAPGEGGERVIAPPVISAPGPLGPLAGGFPVKGKPAPNFALNDTEGNRVELADLRGKVVVINFWATWCGPCKQEFPELQKASARQGSDVVVLALDQAESVGKVTQFRDQFGATFTILLDTTNAVADSYGLSGIPDTIFIDRAGIVRDVVAGPLSAGSFQYKITELQSAP